MKNFIEQKSKRGRMLEVRKLALPNRCIKVRSLANHAEQIEKISNVEIIIDSRIHGLPQGENMRLKS